MKVMYFVLLPLLVCLMACNNSPKSEIIQPKTISALFDLEKEDMYVGYTSPTGRNVYLVWRKAIPENIEMRLFLNKENNFNEALDFLREETNRLMTKGQLKLNVSGASYISPKKYKNIKFICTGGYQFPTNRWWESGNGNAPYIGMIFAYSRQFDLLNGLIKTEGTKDPPYVSSVPGIIWLNGHQL